jgi:hypothetical protein
VLDGVASGPDGIIAGLTESKIWVDMSTVSPDASREVARRVQAQGAEMLDAPVSGSVPQVQTGTLTIMVGGDERAYARVEPILRELGTPTQVGENGQGLALKLAINVSLAVQTLAFAEGLLLADRAGVARERAIEVITQSPIGSPMLKARAGLVLDLSEDGWFDVGLMQKDIVLALDTARRLGVPLLSAAAADEALPLARIRLRAPRHRRPLYRARRSVERPGERAGLTIPAPPARNDGGRPRRGPPSSHGGARRGPATRRREETPGGVPGPPGAVPRPGDQACAGACPRAEHRTMTSSWSPAYAHASCAGWLPCSPDVAGTPGTTYQAKPATVPLARARLSRGRLDRSSRPPRHHSLLDPGQPAGLSAAGLSTLPRTPP